MSLLVVVFWICFAIVGGTSVGYPLLVGVLARIFGRSVQRGSFTGSLTVLLAAHNEENNIERRIAELRRQIAATGLDGELIVVADGCTDRTVERAETFADVRVLAWPENRGKAAALTAGANEATGDILVFADVRQTWADDAIVRMLGNFADPAVGAVSGDLVLESEPGVLAGVGLYWRFEKWLRRKEEPMLVAGRRHRRHRGGAARVVRADPGRHRARRRLLAAQDRDAWPSGHS